MKNKLGFSLIEIVVALIIVSLMMLGLTNLFITGKRIVLHARSRMAGGELGRFFLDPLYANVRQDDWNSATANYNSPGLSIPNGNPGGAETVDGTLYTPRYIISAVPNLPAASNQARKVTVVLNWTEIAPE